MKNSVRLALCALVCLILGGASVNAQNITTVIGGGPVGLTPANASVGSPVAVHRDNAVPPNAYILDNTFGRVLKIDGTTGLMSVYAGNGTTGFSGDGGKAVDAQMNQPSGMCIDANNNVFVADSDNAVIRVIIGPGAVAPPSVTGPVVAGNIYTAVGIPSSTNQIYGGDNGPALSANLHFPDGCAFDSHGNLYIADRGNNEVRVVIGAGNVNAPNIPAGLTGPLTPGNIYVFAGGLTGASPNPPPGGYAANGTAARGGLIYGPFDVAVNTATNDVYIADLGNNFDGNGNPNTQTGQPMNNNVVRMVSGATGLITTVAGVPQTYSGLSLTGVNPPVASGVATAVDLNEPKGLAVDGSGNLYFCDTINQVIRRVSGGNISVVAGSLLKHGYTGDTGAATSATLTFPAGTYVDSNANLFIADDGSNAVREVPSTTGGGMTALDIYTVAGNGHVSFGGNTAAPASGELNTPAGLAVDSAGNIFVADAANDVVRKASAPPSTLSTVAGSPEANGFLNSPVYLNAALGVATDSKGNVYIADTANCLIRKLTSTGATTIAGLEPTVADPTNPGNAPQCGFGAVGAAATGTKIGAVNSVAVDSNGNVFFSDKTNSVIWEVPSTTIGALTAGNLYIVAGTTTAGFAGDGGPANAAQLSGPTGIYIDIYDNLFIADAGNHRIREVPAINIGTTMTAGDIYTIAGNGTSGNTGDGGAATSAELATPFAIVVDNAENLFFSDTTNQTIREITNATGHITTVAGAKNVAGFGGDGGPYGAPAVHFNVPQGLALQPNPSPSTTSNLLVSDSANNRVRSIANIASAAAFARVSFNPNPVVFTAEPVATASAPVPITITNTGTGPLTVTGFTFGGADASDFTKGTDTCTGTPVAASATCTVNVIFTPGAIGARSGTIIVAGAFGSPSATLTGTGGTPTATLNPTSLTFASTTVGTMTPPTQTVTLSNTGNAVTIVNGITFSGANAGDYSENDTCGVKPAATAPVAVGASCTITVQFNPGAVGASAATMTVASNVAGAANTVALSGTGAPATLTLTVKDTDASSTQTVTAGSTATYNLSVSGNQSVTATITCTGAPTAATCTPTPASVAVTAAAAGTFKVSVTTTARGEMLPFNQPSTKMQPPSFMQLAPMASIALLFIVAMLFGWMQNQTGRARTLRVALSLALILMPIAAATVLVGCGGGSSTTTPPPVTGTPAGSYTLTVTATSGSTTASTTVTLVVN